MVLYLPQEYVGPPPSEGSIYDPSQFGGNGGAGGGSTSDLRCSYTTVQNGGRGGGFTVGVETLQIEGLVQISGNLLFKIK